MSGLAFGDPVVGGTTLVRAAIHSPNYVPGTVQPAQPANPGFEATDMSGWTPASGTLTRDTTQHHSGIASAKIVANGSSGVLVGTTVANSPAITAGVNYTLLVWVRANAAWASGAHAGFTWLDVNGSTISTSNGTTVTGLSAGAWNQVSVSATAPAGAVSARLRGVIDGTPASGAIFNFDDYYLRTTQASSGQGWSINRDGTAQFSELTLTNGDVEVGSADIPPWIQTQFATTSAIIFWLDDTHTTFVMLGVDGGGDFIQLYGDNSTQTATVFDKWAITSGVFSRYIDQAASITSIMPGYEYDGTEFVLQGTTIDNQQPWSNLSLASGWTAGDNGATGSDVAQFKWMLDNTVAFRGSATPPSAGVANGATMAIMSSPFLPQHNLWYPAQSTAGNLSPKIRIMTTGEVEIWGFSGSTLTTGVILGGVRYSLDP